MIHTTKALGRLSATELAEILFATPLQESDNVAPAQLRAVLKRTWITGGADCDRFAAQLAQEAGDHPEETARRMRWALNVAQHTLHRPRLPRGASAPAGRLRGGRLRGWPAEGGWLLGGWLRAGRLRGWPAAGWPAAGWPAAGWPAGGAAARPGDPRRGVAVLTGGNRRRSPSGAAGGPVRGRIV